MDLFFSASLPAAAKIWLIIPLGIAAFLVFYFVFLFAIKKFDLKTPGREDDDDLEAEKNVELASDDFTAIAARFLKVAGKGKHCKHRQLCNKTETGSKRYDCS